MMKLDKEKYLTILRNEGLNAAITALHKDKNEWEVATFEGEAGYQREMWDALAEFRDFSRELWDRAMENDGKVGSR